MKTYLIIADGEKVGLIDLDPEEVQMLTRNGLEVHEITNN